MDAQLFADGVMRPLEAWACLGAEENELGTRLIGHVPQVAPRAFLHLVYAPLSERTMEDFREDFGRPVPAQLAQFMSFANGLCIFLGDAVRVYGYVPRNRTAKATIQNYPPSIVLANGAARPKGLHSGDIIVAWHERDESKVCLLEAGDVVRFDSRGGGKVLQRWPDFDTWLIAEIAARDQLYRERWPAPVERLANDLSDR